MSLHDEIAKLPKRPRFPIVGDADECHRFDQQLHNYHEARLALAAKWIATHAHGHDERGYLCLWPQGHQACTCGRDALLAALEVTP